MPGFTRRPLAVFICCLFAGMPASHAAIDTLHLPMTPDDGRTVAEPMAPEPVIQLAANDTPVPLRIERKFNVLGKKRVPLVPGVGIEHPVDLKKDDNYPMFLVAEAMVVMGQRRDLADAMGESDVTAR